MYLNKYPTFRDKLQDEAYWFYSEGPKGRIRKVVQFQKTANPNIYNLALGDDDGTTINFTHISDNKDTKKVLASITDIVEDYTSRFTDRWILVTGDNIAKTRLYQIHTSNNVQEIIDAGYIVMGVKYGEPPEVFIRNKNYDAFWSKSRNEINLNK